MGRPRSPNSFTEPLEFRVTKQQMAFLRHLVSTGKADGISDAVRLGIGTLREVEHGEVVVLGGAQARALRRVAADLEMGLDDAALLGTYLIALYHDTVPKLQGEVRALVARLKAHVETAVATRASSAGARPGGAVSGTTPRSSLQPRPAPGDP